MSHDHTLAANPAGFADVPEATATLTAAHESADFESLVREHAGLLFRVAYGVLRNSHDAEDVVQETFLRVHRTGAKSVNDLRAWLATIAFRLAIDRRRKPEPLDISDFDFPSAGPDAEHTAIRRQKIDRVHRLIAALPEDVRYPLVLSALEELNSRQIGEILGIPESSVRGRILRARQILKDKLTVMEAKP